VSRLVAPAALVDVGLHLLAAAAGEVLLAGVRGWRRWWGTAGRHVDVVDEVATWWARRYMPC
jgi:hypothetical protein